MNHTTRLQQVREKVIESVPEMIEEGKIFLRRPIRLADVLLAMEGTLYSVTPIGCFMFDGQNGFGDEGGKWNLKKNSLDEQSEDTIQFLHEILCQN